MCLCVCMWLIMCVLTYEFCDLFKRDISRIYLFMCMDFWFTKPVPAFSFVPSVVWSRTLHSAGILSPWILMRSLSNSRPQSVQSNPGLYWCGNWEEMNGKYKHKALVPEWGCTLSCWLHSKATWVTVSNISNKHRLKRIKIANNYFSTSDSSHHSLCRRDGAPACDLVN